MEIILHTLIILELSWITNSFNVYEPARVPGWNYFGYSWTDPKPSFVFRKPMAAMVDLTNDLGVAILQDYSYSRSNFAFSPYGVASVLVVLYEGARGESARQIHRAVRFPWDKDITRIGFRDIHRHLRSYFSHEGYLSGITLSKDGSSLKPEYKRILRFYGYDVDVDAPERTSEIPATVPSSTVTTTTPSSTTPGAATTTEGYDVTTGKDPEETNIATSTIRPGYTTSSSDETMTTLTTTEDGESPVSPASTTEESPVAATTEGENEGNMSTEESNQGGREQSTPGDDQESTQENTEQSTQASVDNPEESTLKGNETDAQQYDEQSTQQNTEESTPGANVPDVEEVSQSSTEGDAETVTQQNTEKITQEPEQDNTPSTEQVTEQGDQQNTEQTTQQPKEENTSTTEQNTGWDSQQSTEESTPGYGGITPTEDGDEPVSDEPTESTDREVTTTTVEEVEEFTVSTPVNVEAEFATLQEAEVVGNLTTEEGDRSSRSDALDNGMLIPQLTNERYAYFDDSLGLAYKNPDKRNLIDDTGKQESTSEYWKEIGVALIADGDEVKWEPKTLDEFLKNLMRENGNRTRRLASGKRWRRDSIKSGTKSSLPVAVETSAKFRKQSTKEKRNVSEFLKIPPVTDLSLQLQNGMFDSHVSKNTDLYRVLPKFLFLVDGAIDTPVPMMTYTNIFPFAYIPRLHCKALEFPLDDERYKLLILLPVERRGLRQLIYDLGSYPLREVMDVLRPARVKAMVPTFMVEGFVILTPTLQKMGIWDVFDPRRADLSGMTSDPDLYVRNIEQSVTVVIRNYVEILDIQTRTMAARHIDEDFTASHPFLYFVMDTATNVALMAGQMLDPLNSRIY